MAEHTSGFEKEVLESLTELRTNMKSLIGNGQPGRMGLLENRVGKIERWMWGIAGGAGVVLFIIGLIARLH